MTRTVTNDRPVLSSETSPEETKTVLDKTQNVKSGHEPQKELDTKTDRLADLQS